jgi:hypothetical protein
VFQVATEYSEEKALLKLIEDTDEQLRGRLSRLKAIEGPALRELQQSLRDLLSYPIDWAKLVSAGSAHQDPVLKRAKPLRAQIVSNLKAARSWLESQNPDHLSSQAAYEVLRRALADLEALFDPESEITPVPSTERLVWADLLRVPGLRLDVFAQPEGAPDFRLSKALTAVRDGLLDWPTAFGSALEHGELLSAERIFRLADEGLIDAIDPTEASSRVHQAKERARRRLDEARRTCEIELGHAVSHELLPEAERQTIISTLEALGPAAPLDALEPALERVEKIREEIREKRTQRARELEEEIAQREKELPASEAFARAREALARLDFVTAQDYLDAAKTGRPLSKEPEPDLFANGFFPAFVQAAEGMELDLVRLRDAIRNRRRLGAFDASVLSDEDTAPAADFLRPWFLVKQQTDPGPNLEVFLGLLGFTTVDLKADTAFDRQWRGKARGWNLSVKPLGERELCPLPEYGSKAQGRYRLVTIQRAVSEGELLDIAGTAGVAPTLVFYLGKLGTQRRRELARLCRDRRRHLLVLDDLLVLFLALQPRPRLSAFFRCALPFTLSQPYVTTAGHSSRRCSSAARASAKQSSTPGARTSSSAAGSAARPRCCATWSAAITTLRGESSSATSTCSRKGSALAAPRPTSGSSSPLCCSTRAWSSAA